MLRFGGKFSGSSDSKDFDVCRCQPGQAARAFSFDGNRSRDCFPGRGFPPADADSTRDQMDIDVRHGTTPRGRQATAPAMESVLAHKGTSPLVHELNWPGTESELCRDGSRA